jgi:dTDP-4-dehydrorhamnose 3,5-epimerase-like enzyme
MSPPIQYSLVIPLYRSEETIPKLLDALDYLNGAVDGSLQVVFVDDGSPDKSCDILRQSLTNRPWMWKIVGHARNFGAFEAIRTGLLHSDGKYCAVMAADLQEPVDAIREFFAVLSKQPVDIVIGRRVGRHDPFLSRISSNVFWWLYRKFVNPAIPTGGVDVFGCSQRVAKLLAEFPEANSSLLGQLYWIGFRRHYVDYVRQPRESGVSAWTLRKKLRYMTDSIFAFTNLPLQLLIFVGATGLVGCVGVAAFTIMARCLGWITIAGYTPIVLAIAMSTASILLALGVVGNYVWRTFENTKRRPSSIVALVETGTPITANVCSVSLKQFRVAADPRGTLTAFERSDLPFNVQRIFLVYDVPDRNVRGEHAHRECHQMLFCVRGSCRVMVDDSRSRTEFLLQDPREGLHVPPGIWTVQYGHSHDAVLMVLASHPYDPSDYIRNYNEFLRFVDGKTPCAA